MCSLAESVDGSSLARVAAAARRHGLAVCCPYPERATVGGVECLLSEYGPTHPLGTSYLEDLRPDLYETLATTKPLAP